MSIHFQFSTRFVENIDLFDLQLFTKVPRVYLRSHLLPSVENEPILRGFYRLDSDFSRSIDLMMAVMLVCAGGVVLPGFKTG